MQFPFWRVWELGRGGGKHWGVSCFRSAFLLMTHSICCDNSALCQEYFTFKAQQKCPAWQMTASKAKQSWVVVVLCDQSSVFDCVLDYHPLFSEKKKKKMLWSWHMLPKVSRRHYSQPCHKAPEHLHAQPICALRMQSPFQLCCQKDYFLFSTEMFRVSNDSCLKRLQQWLR